MWELPACDAGSPDCRTNERPLIGKEALILGEARQLLLFVLELRKFLQLFLASLGEHDLRAILVDLK